jgi:hypothetical protein
MRVCAGVFTTWVPRYSPLGNGEPPESSRLPVHGQHPRGFREADQSDICLLLFTHYRPVRASLAPVVSRSDRIRADSPGLAA